MPVSICLFFFVASMASAQWPLEQSNPPAHAPSRRTTSAPAPPASVHGAAPSAQTTSVYRFRMTSIMDSPQGLGGEAYRILAPEGWRVEGGVIWKPDPSNPASAWARLTGPHGQQIGVLPSLVFVWNPQMLGAYFRPGQFYAGTEVEPPVLDPFQCIRRVVIPRYLRNLASARVVGEQPLPELAEAGRAKYPGPEFRNAYFRAGKMRFEYNENGVEMEEDVYLLVSAVQFRVGPTLSTVWAPDEIRYSKAPKGMLDAQIPLFQTAMFSMRPNIHWWAGVQQVSQALTRQQINASNAALAMAQRNQQLADQMARTRESIAHAGDQINSMIMKGYQNRQATMDRINARWDRTIREVEVYHNPDTGENVELPSGYGSGWVNRGGDYLVAGSVNYNPNYASNGDWTRLEKINP
jgi:hypothetical protein